VSGGDFEIGLPEGQVTVLEKEAGPDYDEVEYMPPRPVGEFSSPGISYLHIDIDSLTETAYTPPFDFELPDYKQLGKTLLELAHSYPLETSTPSLDFACEVTSTTDWQIGLSELCELFTYFYFLADEWLDSAEDDPFDQVPKKTIPRAKSNISRSMSTTMVTRSSKLTKPRIGTVGTVRRAATSLSSYSANSTTTKPMPVEVGNDVVLSFEVGEMEDFRFNI